MAHVTDPNRHSDWNDAEPDHPDHDELDEWKREHDAAVEEARKAAYAAWVGGGA
jgi:hypothetical protein